MNKSLLFIFLSPFFSYSFSIIDTKTDQFFTSGKALYDVLSLRIEYVSSQNKLVDTQTIKYVRSLFKEKEIQKYFKNFEKKEKIKSCFVLINDDENPSENKEIQEIYKMFPEIGLSADLFVLIADGKGRFGCFSLKKNISPEQYLAALMEELSLVKIDTSLLQNCLSEEDERNYIKKTRLDYDLLKKEC